MTAVGRPSSAVVATGLVLVAATLAAVAFHGANPHRAFWITDGGNKYLQVLALTGEVSSPGPSSSPFDLALSGGPVDPGNDFVPRASFHFQVDESRVRSFYPPWFPRLVAPFYRAVGFPGLFVLPLLGALGTALATEFLWRRVRPPLEGSGWGWPLLSAAVLFTTPIAFYGLAFWEHTPSVALSTLAVALVVPSTGGRWGAMAAGVLFGLSGWLREESLVLGGVVGLVCLLERRWRVAGGLAGGAGLTLAPLLVLHRRATGSILGTHADGYGEFVAGGWWSRLGTEVGDLWFFLFAYHPVLLWALIGGLPILAVVVLRGASALRAWRTDPPSAHPGLLLAATAAAVGLAVTPWSEEATILNTLSRQALFPGCPLAILAWWKLPGALRAEPPIRRLAAVAGLYVVALPFLLHREAVGIIFGPRHFLAVIPLLAVLAVWGWRHLRREAVSPRFADGILIALLLAGLVVQALGVRDLTVKRRATAAQGEAVARWAAEHGVRDVASDVFWFAEEHADLWRSFEMREVTDAASLTRLRGALTTQGRERFVLVVSPLFRSLTVDTLRTVEPEAVLPLPAPEVPHLSAQALLLRSVSPSNPESDPRPEEPRP